MESKEPIQPAIVLVCGHAGAGKDTVADVFVRLAEFELRKFADPLYDMLAAGWGTSRDMLDMWKRQNALLPATGVTVRHALQTLGTEWGRQMMHENVWSNICAARIDASQNAYGDLFQQRFVISDLRFMNELRLMRARYHTRCFVIGIERPDAEGSGMVHASEQDIQMLLQEADIVLKNEGTLEELEDKARSLIEMWSDSGLLV